jgi:hypothetical protein
VKSVEGQGSAFTFSLPLVLEEVKTETENKKN